VSAQVVLAILTGLLGLLSAAALALLNSGITARAGIDENLRSERLKAYPALWESSGAVSWWPRQDVPRASLEALHQNLRSWYYSTGGLFLSEAARARYGEVQEHIEALLRHPARATDSLGPTAYDDLFHTASALRTALTQDLDTRRRKSYREERRRARWHAQAAAEAEIRIERAVADPSPFRADAGVDDHGRPAPTRTPDGDEEP